MAYSFYRAITIDYTKVSASNHTDFPVLISGTYSYLATVANGGKVQNANGYDISFYSDNTLNSKLKHEVERWVSTTGEIVMWVKIPTLSFTVNTIIYMVYGDSSISTDQSDKTNVWDSDYKGVWHLPNGTTLTALDSTINGVDGTINSSTAVTGKLGGGANFTATSNIDLGNNLVLASVQPFTFSGWVKVDSIGATIERIIGDGGYHDTTAGWFVFKFQSFIYFTYRTSAGGNTNVLQNRTVNSVLSAGVWAHVTVTKSNLRTNAGLKMYINGNNVSIQNQPDFDNLSSDYSNAVNARMGNDSANTSQLVGSLDEMRVAWTERSAGWILTEYNTQNNPSTFYSVGSEMLPLLPGYISGISTIQGITSITF